MADWTFLLRLKVQSETFDSLGLFLFFVDLYLYLYPTQKNKKKEPYEFQK